jgi:signal transduction histidine kinase
VTATLAAADLRPVDLFDEIDDEQLEEWARAATVHEYAAGDVVAEQGKASDRFFLVLEGTIQALMIENGRAEPTTQHVAPTWMGAIPVLTETPIGVRMQAKTPVRVAVIQAPEFTDLALRHRPVHRRIMRQVRPVVSRITAMEQNRERLASLGTMAAGLAHELNNPAAAATRAASDLADALEVQSSTIGHFVEAGIERAEAQQLVDLQRQALAQACERTPLNTLDAADAEDDLADALEELGVQDAWRFAGALAGAGLDAEWARRVAGLAGDATGAALAWVAASLAARELAAELTESTERMSHLVSAVKTYAYMDRGEVIDADLHEGLETTLVVLGHKLKHTSIQVERDYDRSIPRVTMRGSELNQVWTNLLHNAIDALGQSGTIKITTRRDGACAEVEIADDGPGIPDGVRDRIFEPFFTTKAVGQGTGLGLDTVRRIVEDRHRGTIAVESEPGRTVFRVRLPLDGAAQ